MTTKAKLIFDKAFSKPRDPRSREYKAGVFDILRLQCGEISSCICPYDAGTAQADAWISGTEEGRHLFKATESQEEAEGFQREMNAQLRRVDLKLIQDKTE